MGAPLEVWVAKKKSVFFSENTWMRINEQPGRAAGLHSGRPQTCAPQLEGDQLAPVCAVLQQTESYTRRGGESERQWGWR